MGFLFNVGTHTPIFIFNIYVFAFFRSLEAIERAISKVWTIIYCYIIKMIFVIKLRLLKGKHSPVIIYL